MLILRILIDICREIGLLSAVLLNAPSDNLGPEREQQRRANGNDRSMRACDLARNEVQLMLDARLAVASSC